MKQQTENKKQQNRKGLLAALLVCLAGLLLAAVIIGVRAADKLVKQFKNESDEDIIDI